MKAQFPAVAVLLFLVGSASAQECTTMLAAGIGIGAGVTAVLFVTGILIYRYIKRRREQQYASMHEGDSERVEEMRNAPPSPPSKDIQSTSVVTPSATGSAVRPRSATLQAAVEKLQLDPAAQLSVDDFQTKWAAAPVSESMEVALYTIPDEDALAELLAPQNVLCLASGTVNSQMKFYFYGRQMHTGVLLLAEVVVGINTRVLSGRFKCVDTKLTPLFADIFRGSLRTIMK